MYMSFGDCYFCTLTANAKTIEHVASTFLRDQLPWKSVLCAGILLYFRPFTKITTIAGKFSDPSSRQVKDKGYIFGFF